MKRTCSWLIILVIALISSGCQRNTGRQIGFVVTTLANPYFVDMTNAAKEEAQKHPGVELLVQAPEAATDVERQLKIIDDLIARRVSVLCIVPADSKAIAGAILRANQAGIPVLVLDNRADPATLAASKATITSFIGSDNVLGGRLAGDFVAQALNGKGKVAILEGVSGVDAAIQRKTGFLESLKGHPGVTVAASQTANWSRELGMNTAQTILLANPDLNAIFAANDEMALGALQAVRGRAGQPVLVVGFDAIDEALAAVEAGTLAGTVAQLPAQVGRLGVQTAMQLLGGETVSSEVSVPVQLITKDNVATFRQARR